MADSMEKFVLEYDVKMDEAIKRLTQIQTQIESTNKLWNNKIGTMDKLRDAARAVSREFPPAAQNLTGMLGSLTRFGPVSGAAAAGVMGLAGAIRIASRQAEILNQQRERALRLGTTPMDIENFTRNANVASRGAVGFSGANDIYEKVAAMLSSAYANPTQMNRDAFLLRQAGVGINAPNGTVNTTNQALAQLSKGLNGMSQSAAYATGQMMGFTQNQVDALRQLNGAVTDSTNMTGEQALAYMRSEQAARQFQAAQGSLSEGWREMETAIADVALPALSRLESAIARVFRDAAHAIDESTQHAARDNFIQQGINQEIQRRKLAANKGQTDAPPDFAGNPDTAMLAYRDDQNTLTNKERDALTQSLGAQWDKKNADDKKQAEKQLKDQQKVSEDARSDQLMFERSVALFSTSVGTMSANLLDSKRAWAAWAAEVASGAFNGKKDGGQPRGTAMYHPNNVPYGYAGGYSGNAQGSGQTATLPTGMQVSIAKDVHDYDPQIAAAAKKYGIDPLDLKSIIAQESKFDKDAVSAKGATGLGQIMPDTARLYGVSPDDLRDPSTNIDLAARVYSDALKRQKGDPIAAKRDYNAGPNQARWENNETINYPFAVAAQREYMTMPGAPVQSRPDQRAAAQASAQANKDQVARLSLDVDKITAAINEMTRRLESILNARSAQQKNGASKEQLAVTDKYVSETRQGIEHAKQLRETVQGLRDRAVAAGGRIVPGDGAAGAAPAAPASVQASDQGAAGATVQAKGAGQQPTNVQGATAANGQIAGAPWATTDAYNAAAKPTFTFSGGDEHGPAFGRAALRRQMSLAAIAGELSSESGIPVPVGALAQGQVSRGDVQWAESNLYTKKLNELAGLQNVLGNPNAASVLSPQALSAKQSELRQVMVDLEVMKASFGRIADESPEGDRRLTQGAPRAPVIQVSGVNINVSGAQDPHATAREVERVLLGHAKEIANMHAGSMIG
ncbi:lytic transglycosylase domain-containing protein [Burkholderia gladioli]|uniref:lytic transglycosylase domain-containing protein n=1 Tax=Burkholderia gladioli TaxID=28095 RepID=UPI00163EDFEA|nr:transglycosylase SLT domain-containing protein [Burkholderia gladioli]